MLSSKDTLKTVDDPKLPCGYCVGWADDADDDTGQTVYPVNARGERLTVLYSGVHARCSASVDAYMAEVAAERSEGAAW